MPSFITIAAEWRYGHPNLITFIQWFKHPRGLSSDRIMAGWRFLPVFITHYIGWISIFFINLLQTTFFLGEIFGFIFWIIFIIRLIISYLTVKNWLSTSSITNWISWLLKMIALLPIFTPNPLLLLTHLSLIVNISHIKSNSLRNLIIITSRR